ncbi:hypothetical protein [Aldersonia kunmingensis]|uniref:hypothetical protein n=1 Tax=Aldersonia kunmingensis TaxID=408066 RepID=UPI000833B170|nr:hypothetical protein [Aldersonia kunmingensis]
MPGVVDPIARETIPAQPDKATDEQRPGSCQGRARTVEHRIGIDDRRIPFAEKELKPRPCA